jgi:hypothetical protein
MRIVRKPSPTLLSFALLVLCAGCTDQQSVTGVPTAAIRSSDVMGSDMAYGAHDYHLTSFDISTLTLSATSNLVPPNPVVPTDPYIPGDPYRTFTASVATDTRFVPAPLDRYQPGDPYCPGLAAHYNASLAVSTSDGGLFYGLIGQMAANHCNARVLVDLTSATIRSFEPVP